LSPGLPTIRGDGIQLQQVILNLILNGAAAMRNSPSGQRKIILRTAMLDSRTVKAFVTDFGTGIDEKNIERLFEPFYTTKPEGLGMGLSISQTVSNAYGGLEQPRRGRHHLCLHVAGKPWGSGPLTPDPAHWTKVQYLSPSNFHKLLSNPTHLIAFFEEIAG